MLRGVATGACLYAFAALAPSAEAQDAATPDAESKAKQDAKAKETAAEKKEREEAIAALPTWESYGAGGEAGMEETFFRLTRDFVMTSDDSIHPLGHVPIWPRGEFKIAGFRVLPFVREGVTWDSNFYRQPETGNGPNSQGRKAEWTHENELGVMADTALMGGRLGISMSIDSIWSVRYGHDAPSDTWDFEGQLGARYNWPSGVWIAGGYRYNRSHDPADLPTVSDDYGRATHGAFFNLGFDRDIFFGSKLQFEFGVHTRDVDASNQAYADGNRTETTIYAKASYPFLGRKTTRLFAVVSDTFNQRDSQAINDGSTVSFNTGIEGSIPLREGEYRGLRGQLSVGFQHGFYENKSYRQGSQEIVNDNSQDKTTLLFIAALQYIMSPKTTTDLRYTHDTQFSFYGNYEVVDRVEFSVSHTFSRALTGRADTYWEHTDPSGKQPQETVNGTDFSHGATNVNREGAGVGLRYAVNEWMDLDLSVNVENRNDVSENSFKNYEGVFGITFYLNALTSKARVGSDR